jgi:hypothetical protein
LKKQVVGTAAALCKLASGLTPLGPSSVADYIRLKIDSNSSSSSSSNNNSYNPKGAEARKGVKMESGPSSRERNVRLEKEEKDERDERDKNSSRGHHYECEVEDIYLSYDTSEAVTSHTAPSISPQQPPYINNIASPNARLTLALFEWVVCGGDPVLSSIDSIVTIALRDFRTIQDFQNEVKDHHVSALVQSKTQRRGSVGEKRSEIDDYSESAHRGENPFVVPSEAYARMDCPQCVRTIIEILVISSQIYRKAGKSSKFIY